MTNNLINKIVTRVKEYPGEMLPRFYDLRLGDNVIKFLLAFYERVYGNGGLTFHSEETARSDDKDILVSSTAMRASRLRIGDEYFGSLLSRSEHSSYVIGAFLNEENDLLYWPGQVRFFLFISCGCRCLMGGKHVNIILHSLNGFSNMKDVIISMLLLECNSYKDGQ